MTRPRLTKEEYDVVKRYRNRKSVVLVIPDLHSPFIKKGFLDFCKDISYKYGCNRTVFIGDLLDNHYSSFHESDPDGLSAGDELDVAIDKLNLYIDAFPHAKVCLGNHDNIPNRKAFTGGLSKRWIRSIEEIIDAPGWEFAEEWHIEGVLYTHGTARKARFRAKDELINIVQGHYHSESYIEYYVGLYRKIFAMQVGSGIDRRSYGMAYGRHFKKVHLNCGVVIDGMPILEYMKL